MHGRTDLQQEEPGGDRIRRYEVTPLPGGENHPFGLPPEVAKKVPIRVPVKYDEDEAGNVTLVYKKNFSRTERWLAKRLGGIEDIRRPMDNQGSDVWKMCDGQHTVLEICKWMKEKYGDEIEPTGTRIFGFLRIMRERNIVIMLDKKVTDEDKEKFEQSLIREDDIDKETPDENE